MIRTAIGPLFASLTLALALAATGVGAEGPGVRDTLLAAPPTARLGGDTTVDIVGPDAFTQLAANAPTERQRDFALGSRLFAVEWAPFPNAVRIFDGLGPTFNRESCAGCHAAHGRGQPPVTDDGPLDSMLIRLSAAGPEGIAPTIAYGDQLNDRAIDGVPPEGRATIVWEDVPGTYGDGTPYTLRRPTVVLHDLSHGPIGSVLTSPRVAQALIGLGLLEAVPGSTLLALADPDDADGDGISGRANRLGPDGAIGRFGWKANVVDLRHQTAAAAIGDMGLTTSLYPDQNCPPVQAACVASAAEPGLEISDPFLERMVTAMRTVAVPAQRAAGTPEVAAGLAAFRRFGCHACHVPTLITDGAASLPELRHQTFHPYTDLLLHDMGPGLADNRPDFDASGSEWRTPPLWGLGLVPTVNGHDRLLHDGRARGFAEAILWHGGEAEAAKEAFRTAEPAERAALIAFLASL